MVKEKSSLIHDNVNTDNNKSIYNESDTSKKYTLITDQRGFSINNSDDYKRIIHVIQELECKIYNY